MGKIYSVREMNKKISEIIEERWNDQIRVEGIVTKKDNKIFTVANQAKDSYVSCYYKHVQSIPNKGERIMMVGKLKTYIDFNKRYSNYQFLVENILIHDNKEEIEKNKGVNISDLHRCLQERCNDDEFLITGQINSNYNSNNEWFRLLDLDKSQKYFLNCICLDKGDKERIVANEAIVLRGRVRIHCEQDINKFYIECICIEDIDVQKHNFKNNHIIPYYPQKIGVIVTQASQVYLDIVNTMKENYPCIKIKYDCDVNNQKQDIQQNYLEKYNKWMEPIELEVLRCAMRDEEASKDVVKAINILENNKCDMILIGQGGGNKGFQHCIDHEKILFSIVNSEVPIACGVGHTNDRSLLDQVVSCSYDTPTKMAGKIMQMWGERFFSKFEDMEKVIETLDGRLDLKQFYHRELKKAARRCHCDAHCNKDDKEEALTFSEALKRKKSIKLREAIINYEAYVNEIELLQIIEKLDKDNDIISEILDFKGYSKILIYLGKIVQEFKGKYLDELDKAKLRNYIKLLTVSKIRISILNRLFNYETILR